MFSSLGHSNSCIPRNFQYMRDCVILMNDWLVSLSLNSLLLTQHPTSFKSSSFIIHLCPSPQHPRDCWKSLFCLLDSSHGTSHSTCPCSTWYSCTLHLYNKFDSSSDIHPIQYFPGQMSEGFWRRGNTMEVMSDCLVLFVDILSFDSWQSRIRIFPHLGSDNLSL